MRDYNYSDIVNMQEAAIRRVNEMERKAREAAQKTNREFSRKNNPSPPVSQGAENLSGSFQQNKSAPLGGNLSQSSPGNSTSKRQNGGNSQNDNRNARHKNASSVSQNHGNFQSLSGQNEFTAQSFNQNRSPSSNFQNRNFRQNNAPSGNRGGGKIPPARQTSGKRNAPQDSSPIAGEGGIFSSLSGIFGAFDKDTLLVLGVMYILLKDGADKGLIFALTYIIL